MEVARRIPQEELSFNAIGTQLGVSKQAMYRYFTNLEALKEALSRSFLRDIADERDTRGVSQSTANDNFCDFFLSFVLEFRQAAEANPSYHKLKESNWGGIGPDKDPMSTWLTSRLEMYFRIAKHCNVDLNDAVQMWWVGVQLCGLSGENGVSDSDLEKFYIGLEQAAPSGDDAEFPTIAAYLRDSQDREMSSDAFFTRYARAVVWGLAHEFGLPEPTLPDV